MGVHGAGTHGRIKAIYKVAIKMPNKALFLGGELLLARAGYPLQAWLGRATHSPASDVIGDQYCPEDSRLPGGKVPRYGLSFR